jgi:hypothetical protein
LCAPWLSGSSMMRWAGALCLVADQPQGGVRGWLRILYGEAHVPFILYVPGGGCEHSDIIVQPQDIFATILGLAGVPVPEGIESQGRLAYNLFPALSRRLNQQHRSACGWQCPMLAARSVCYSSATLRSHSRSSSRLAPAPPQTMTSTGARPDNTAALS